MGMSKKAKALMTGEKSAEWNKYRISMRHAQNEYTAEADRVNEAMKSKSNKAKFWGGVAFIIGAAIVVGTGGFGVAAMSKGIGLALAAGTVGGVAGYAAGAASLANTANIGWNKSKEEIMGQIHDPRFGAGQAADEKLQLKGDIERDVTAADAYEEGGALSQVLYENIGKTSSYIGAGA